MKKKVKKNIIDVIKKKWKLFIYNYNFKDGFNKKVDFIIMTALIIDLIVLYLVW